MKLIGYPIDQRLSHPTVAELSFHLSVLRRDHAIQLDMLNGPWLAGGSLVRMLWTGNFPGQESDLDIFLPKEDERKPERNRSKYSDLWNDPTSDVPHVRGLTDVRGENDYTYQLIHTTATGIKEILETFDLTISQFATDGNLIIGSEEAWMDLSRGEFRKTEAHGHRATEHRIEKYKTMGLNFINPIEEIIPDDDLPF